MKIAKNKTMAILIAILLMLSMTASLTLLPTAIAHTPAWQIATYGFMTVAPDPVGIGQVTYWNFWVDKVPPTAAFIWGYRWHDMTVTVTRPDGTTQTLGPFDSDATGGTWSSFIPDQVGNYTFVGHFSTQTVTNENPYPYNTSFNLYPEFIGDTYLASTSNTAILQVQQDLIPTMATNPLPTNYWERPIHSMNREWSIIAGTWLASIQTYSAGNFRPYTTAPNSAHVIWTKPVAFGGQLGGEFGSIDTSINAAGMAYEPKFNTPIIMNGVLYYTQIPGSDNNPGPLTAVNLRTGETIWTQNITTNLAYGMMYNLVNGDQYGAHSYLFTQYVPGAFVTTSGVPRPANVWSMYDAMTGQWILDIANVTAGTIVEGPNGELLSYRAAGGKLSLWNSTLCIESASFKYNTYRAYSPAEIWRPPQWVTIDWAGGNQWSLPLPTSISGNPISLGISAIDNASNIVLLTQSAPGIPGGSQAGWRIDAGFDLKTGQILWGPINRTLTPWVSFNLGPEADNVYTEYNSQMQTWTAYSMTNGEKLWGPTQPYSSVWGYFDRRNAIAGYGNLYAWTLGGSVYSYNLKTGALNWVYYAGDAGYETPYGVFPFFSQTGLLADGKFFIVAGHNYTPPLFKDAKVYAINVTNGKLIWSSLDFGIDSNNNPMPISDGVMLGLNSYDNQIYAWGKGSSKLTVTAPSVGVTTTTPITISGTVTDISAGSEQHAVAMNFPNGLPAVSDASMSAFMEAVYQQQPMPNNVTGVPITINVVDSNGNYRPIGTTTSTPYGTYSLTWTPDISGDYTIVANFAGTESYYPSEASAAFYANVPAATPAPTNALIQTLSDTYLLPGIVAIIVAIAVVGVILALLVTRNRR